MTASLKLSIPRPTALYLKQSTAEFAADVRLVFSNARLYNADPNSLVHASARELYEMFETKFAALGPNLDDPPLKRKKTAGGASASAASTNHNTSSSYSPVGGGGLDGGEHEPEKDRKRKSGGGGKSGGTGDGNSSGSGSATKKQRAAPAKSASKPAPPAAQAPVAAPPPVPAPPASDEFSDANMPPSMLMMQRRIAEMEAQILRMQGQTPAPPVRFFAFVVL